MKILKTPVASVLILLAVVLTSCSVMERTESEPTLDEPTPTADEQRDPTPVQAQIPTLEPTSTATPLPPPAPIPTPTPAPTLDPIPTPTPTPEPLSRVATETPCCGLFEWLDDGRLLVFDEVPGEGEGAWMIEIESGERSFIARGFGLASSGSGIIAFPEKSGGRLVVRDFHGSDVSVLPNDGVAGWPSPNGEKVAWLQLLPIRTPSSTVDRAVRLIVAEIQSGEIRSILDLQAAEVQWLPDSRHVLVSARNLAFEQSGVWLIDIETGEYDVLFQENFLRSVQLSPDGRRVAFMRTFNDHPADNGVWALDLASRELTRLFESGSFRWDADGDHGWRLELAAPGERNDRLTKLDIDHGDLSSVVELPGRVHLDAWRISPQGSFVAFWRESDGQVVVHSLE